VFTINKTYDFVTLAPAILGANYTNMKVKGIVTLEEAIKHADVVTMHESVIPVIPGLPPTVNDLIFIIFVDANGHELVLADSYIDATSIVATTVINLDIKISGVDSAMESILNLRLRELGIANFTITRF